MMSKKLTFGELESGDKFIDFPTDGDNDGHGGYKIAYNVFIKIDPSRELHNSFTEHEIYSDINAINISNGNSSKFTDSMNVIKLNQ